MSPLKEKTPSGAKGKDTVTTAVSRPLFQPKKVNEHKAARKRKSKPAPPETTPNLNLPQMDSTTLVPAGLVSSRVSQLAGGQVDDGETK